MDQESQAKLAQILEEYLANSISKETKELLFKLVVNS
jgi:hypothetical protein